METNYEHLLSLGIRKMATAIWNYTQDPCVFCPKERLHRCDENCREGVSEWLASPYIPGSLIWKEEKK